MWNVNSIFCKTNFLFYKLLLICWTDIIRCWNYETEPDNFVVLNTLSLVAVVHDRRVVSSVSAADPRFRRLRLHQRQRRRRKATVCQWSGQSCPAQRHVTLVWRLSQKLSKVSRFYRTSAFKAMCTETERHKTHQNIFITTSTILDQFWWKLICSGLDILATEFDKILQLHLNNVTTLPCKTS